jgi:hypothetical protein
MKLKFTRSSSKYAQNFWNKFKKNNKPIEINENDIEYFKKLKKNNKIKGAIMNKEMDLGFSKMIAVSDDIKIESDDISTSIFCPQLNFDTVTGRDLTDVDLHSSLKTSIAISKIQYQMLLHILASFSDIFELIDESIIDDIFEDSDEKEKYKNKLRKLKKEYERKKELNTKKELKMKKL